MIHSWFSSSVFQHTLGAPGQEPWAPDSPEETSGMQRWVPPSRLLRAWISFPGKARPLSPPRTHPHSGGQICLWQPRAKLAHPRHTQISGPSKDVLVGTWLDSCLGSRLRC